MGRLKHIVDLVQSSASGAQARLQLARVGLKAGLNLSAISASTPDNPEAEEKILRAARSVLGREIFIDNRRQQ